MDDVVVDGVVRWDAIPSRSRQVLEVIGITIKHHRQELLDGHLKAIFEGAVETARRGERARFGCWAPVEDGNIYERSSDSATDYECASSSVSGLVRLGLFKPMKTDVPEMKPAELTELGLRTIMNAVDAGHIYAPDWPLGGATKE